MTKDQLLNVIIPWKFGKGKPRNALKPLLQSNKKEDVTRASMLAFNFAESSLADNTNNEDGDVNHAQEAIKALCQLSGVGPATASAVLSAYCPQSFAFMDDEVIECLYEAKRGYTLKIYLAVNGRCVDIAEGLNGASGGSSGGWTPADVAKALWTVATMSARNDEVGLCKVFGD
uniref:HhH-GPD domain-containing protein n=1 Tax=Skeletonema marinoi TaxID=267567 RepID=A0A7S2M6X0_9STRA